MEGNKFNKENMSALITTSSDHSKLDGTPAFAATGCYDLEKDKIVVTPGFVCLYLNEDPDQEIAGRFVNRLRNHDGVEGPHYNPQTLKLEFLN
ncbi:MAG: hypothetical protein ACHQVK_01920 [Candidatus Paceibacterales bacterium]